MNRTVVNDYVLNYPQGQSYSTTAIQHSERKMTFKRIISYCKTIFRLPRKYEFLDDLGEGGFGKVVKCLDKETRQTVAIKLPKFLDGSSTNEAAMLKRFRDLNLDKHNIVKCFDSWQTRFGNALVLEVFDISLDDYFQKRILMPMLLSDIRTIIQQLATALDALKGIGVIHTDVKPHNIMMENQHSRPFQVKLIDFGLAIPISEASQGAHLQPLCVRSPEIILGRPFSEAIDMWSMGCVMAKMICGYPLFSGPSEYELLKDIVEVLGLPADHVFNDGRKTKDYCMRTKFNTWRLKTSMEYGGFKFPRLYECHNVKSLDDLKKMREEEENKAEAVEREHCIELLKAMLTIDADKRITPREVLNHPFITKDYRNSQMNLSETSSDEALASTSDKSANYTSSPIIGPSGVIMVQPSPPENTRLLEDLESAVSSQMNLSETSDKSANYTSSPIIGPSGVIMVQPSPPKNTRLLEDLESTVSSQMNLSETSSDDTQGVQSGLNKTSESSVSDTKSNTKSAICEDRTTCGDIGTKKTREKKKNWFQRLFSWMKKTFSWRVDCDDEDQGSMK